MPLWICLILLDLFVTYLGIVNIGKRLHDMEFSAWYGAVFSVILLFFSVLAPENSIVLLVNVLVGFALLLMPGTKGANKYGEDPLEEN